MHCEVAIISLTYLILEAKGGRESIFTSRGYGGAIRENQSLCLTRWKVAKGVLTGGGGDRGVGGGPTAAGGAQPPSAWGRQCGGSTGAGDKGNEMQQKEVPRHPPCTGTGGLLPPRRVSGMIHVSL